MNLAQRTAALDGFTEPGALELAQGPVCADSLDREAGFIRFPVFFSNFFAACSRPTLHEWEHNLCCEGGDNALRACPECLGGAGVIAPVHEVTNGHF